MHSDTQPLTGTVKWYNYKKGFGFITPDTGAEDVFIHHSVLPAASQKKLDSGDRIAFTVEHQQRGPAAIDVRPLSAGQNPPQPVIPDQLFASLGLDPSLTRAVAVAGYTEPTPIQAQAIPAILAGRDVLGCAQTGTGKTAAFALPILHHLARTVTSNGDGRKSKGVPRPIRALILSPTRELAIQIADSFSVYGRFTGLNNTVIYGGVGQQTQVQALQRGVDILTATPGRLLDLIGQGYVKLSQIEVFVLDEADRMLDMGFIHDVRRIVKLIPVKRQTLLFSATIPEPITQLAAAILHQPVQITISPDQPTVEAIEQAIYFVDQKQKQALLERLLVDEAVTRALVFTRTKHGANRVVKRLAKAGIPAEPIHGNKSQNARQKSLKNFQAGKTRVLVATDVVARGIDVDQVSHVIQFDLPNEPETYVHRIGRTGRAGAIGTAIAFCANDERAYLKAIEKLIRMPLPRVS